MTKLMLISKCLLKKRTLLMILTPVLSNGIIGEGKKCDFPL